MIAITGANGNLGKATIGFLLKKIKPEQIVAIVRDPKKMDDLKDSGIQIRIADYDDLDSLNEALNGVEKLLQISAISIGEQGVKEEANVVKAARQQGVQHIVYTGAVKPKADAHFMATQQCLATESAILDSGIPHTFFGNSLYMETIPIFIGEALDHGTIYYPAGNGAVSFVSRVDIAEALSNVISSQGHENKRYEITGSKAYTFKEVALILTTERKITVSYVNIPNVVLAEELDKFQIPDDQIGWQLSLADSIKANEFSYVDGTLEDLLKRKPVELKDYLRNL
ncbi:NAD(P)-dependent oxidoreductase [Pedobacter ginsengisoli]|uniref:NAD(P)-dependent oxidoreductase n=1 Tax=Pedobacter ginsengisoli TaxID=363852 RepID=A0A2D1U5L1_9SPHI|nr:SDR family oxidoreductase [Pedobacter ginsengisoli]ATP56887.1 NAD(P)-dependent oxidoreductase [Pedobacter ginsengisoli]